MPMHKLELSNLSVAQGFELANLCSRMCFFLRAFFQQQVLVSSHFYTGGSRMCTAICIPAAPECAKSPTKVGTMWLGTPPSEEFAKGELVRFGGSFKGEGGQRGGESMHCCAPHTPQPEVGTAPSPGCSCAWVAGSVGCWARENRAGMKGSPLFSPSAYVIGGGKLAWAEC